MASKFGNGKKDSGFPEAKVLKQRVRDIIDPERDLGHSDTK
ncbi:selenoprotein W-related protein [Vibrio sp. JCM 19053]|nr:selenoprotein W-related protein [Vibrio sp. JCM 19053]